MEVGKPLPVTRSAPPPEVATGEGAHWEGLEETDEFRRLVSARWRFVAPATVFFRDSTTNVEVPGTISVDASGTIATITPGTTLLGAAGITATFTV